MRTHLLRAVFVMVTFVFPSVSGAQSIALLASRPHEIPFHLVSGYLIVVEGSVASFDHLKFVVDTGTTRTCIDRRLAQQLALPLEVQHILRFGKRVPVNSTHLSRLTLGPLQAENFTVNVADLSHVANTGARMDAIIGLDLLESFPFEIDYEQMRVKFGPIQSMAQSAPFNAVPFLPIVSLDLNGFESVLLIDTGTRNIVLYSERLPGSSANWKLLETEIWADSIGGVTQARKAVLRGAASGSGCAPHEVYLIHAPRHDPLAMVNGFLSPVALGIRQIGFDFDRHFVTWNDKSVGTIANARNTRTKPD